MKFYYDFSLYYTSQPNLAGSNSRCFVRSTYGVVRAQLFRIVNRQEKFSKAEKTGAGKEDWHRQSEHLDGVA